MLTSEMSVGLALFLWPVMISSRTTPKLYTSHFSVKRPCAAYSGAVYPLQLKVNTSMSAFFFLKKECVQKKNVFSHGRTSKKGRHAHMHVYILVSTLLIVAEISSFSFEMLSKQLHPI